jgi:two-component system response regulator HydG
MTSATLAASIDSGRFTPDEPGTGPVSSLAPREGAAWSTNTAARKNPPRARLYESLPPPAGLKQLRHLVGSSPAVVQMLQLLEPLSRSEITLTLIGETGTGKDVLARHVHQHSTRAERPFVVFDCGAVAANLAESELFGHERGAFTGALSVHAGAFERAHTGTLFLDEIGELPLDLQTRLLRVLSSHCVRRVGGTQDRPVDVRIVAATNRDLRREVAAGRFRQDLYFRLAAAVVQVPALRERLDDVPVLVERLLGDLGYAQVWASAPALSLLASRSWPGNIRELKNALACALAFLDGPTLEPHHFRFPVASEPRSGVELLPLAGVRLDTLEREAIFQTLRQTQGNKVRAAEILGIAASTLYEKLKRYQRSSAASP